jgi:RNA polymerase sigma factor (sigma-70 family)
MRRLSDVRTAVRRWLSALGRQTTELTQRATSVQKPRAARSRQRACQARFRESLLDWRLLPDSRNIRLDGARLPRLLSIAVSSGDRVRFWDDASWPLSFFMEWVVRHASSERMDSELLGSLIDRFAAALELYARQWSDAPEDVVQEAFVELAAQREPPLNPAAWLFRSVRNRAINAGMASRRRRQYEAAAADVRPWFETNSAARQETAVDPDSAQTALAALPVEQREVIVAHLWGGLTFEQIAELVGSSASSAHRLYHAGLITLRERLGVPCPKNTSRQIPS